MDASTSSIRQPDPPNVILLHASAVYIGNGALVFTGRSGAGKSTICRILGEFGTKIADDMVYLVRRSETKWIVTDARERAEGGPLTNLEVIAMQGAPLRAILEVHKDVGVYIQSISAVKMCNNLARAYFDLHYWACHYNAETKRAAFAHLATLARSVPSYDLFFSITHQTPQAIHYELNRLGIFHSEYGPPVKEEE